LAMLINAAEWLTRRSTVGLLLNVFPIFLPHAGASAIPHAEKFIHKPNAQIGAISIGHIQLAPVEFAVRLYLALAAPRSHGIEYKKRDEAARFISLFYTTTELFTHFCPFYTR